MPLHLQTTAHGVEGLQTTRASTRVCRWPKEARGSVNNLRDVQTAVDLKEVVEPQLQSILKTLVVKFCRAQTTKSEQTKELASHAKRLFTASPDRA